MARNPVQFQKGISLNEFLSLYGTEMCDSVKMNPIMLLPAPSSRQSCP